MSLTEMAEKVLHQQRNVFSPIAQRRHLNGNNVKSVVQIFPERTVINQRLNGFVCC